MKTIADKITELGGELAPPADSGEISQLEARIGLSIPDGLRDLLKQHNGSLRMTDEVWWNFFTCEEITTFCQYRNKDTFYPDNNCLREIDPSAEAVSLPGSNLIVFADAMIDAPTFGVFHLSGHRYDGMVFDTSYGSLSATSFGAWIAWFIAREEDGIPFIYPTEPEQDVHGNTH